MTAEWHHVSVSHRGYEASVLYRGVKEQEFVWIALRRMIDAYADSTEAEPWYRRLWNRLTGKPTGLLRVELPAFGDYADLSLSRARW